MNVRMYSDSLTTGTLFNVLIYIYIYLFIVHHEHALRFDRLAWSASTADVDGAP